MMETKDIMSMFVGLIIAALGVLPLLNNFKIGPSWFDFSSFLSATIVTWVLAVAALYLVFNSIIEITNSNSIGWMSILVAFVVLAVGVLQILKGFSIGPGLFGITIPAIVYNIMFIAEGVFLMIAGFAMEM